MTDYHRVDRDTQRLSCHVGVLSTNTYDLHLKVVHTCVMLLALTEIVRLVQS